MSNFKSGSGNLDFDDDDDSESGESETASESISTDRGNESPESDINKTTNESTGQAMTQSGTVSASEQYPYFVRRSNVGDERDTRLEIHVRDKIANQETTFRNELATRLDANEISKTDAREFALLAAFKHPDLVAELMKKEGFGAVE
jgi:hypothetical protein